MKAAYIEEFGGPEKLIYGDRPEPEPGPSEILLRMHASALNRLDIGLRSGNSRYSGGLPRILGCDIAGEVAHLGTGVDGFSVGDRVIVDNRVKCGQCPPCRAGQDQLCRRQNRIGVDYDGGFAQYCVVPSINTHKIADWLTWEEAGAISLAYHTAWHCLMVRAQLRPWDTILIQAAGSGVGSAGIKIARLVGARVITTAGSEEKLVKARELGADEAINYHTTPSFSQRVKELTNGEGVDVVLDMVGATVWEENLLSLKEYGRLVITGVTAGNQSNINLALLQGRPLTLMGSGGRTRQSFADMVSVINRGELKPVVSQVFPLEEASQAHRTMEESNFFGKIVVRIP